MITAQGLVQLGFSPEDFTLQDASDGKGAYIAQWNSASPQPSAVEIETAHIEWQAEWDTTQYQRDRAAAYASIGDQLDMRYHDLQDGTTTWADHVADVKARYPK